MTLTFVQDDRVIKICNLYKYFVAKGYEVTNTFTMVASLREISAKKKNLVSMANINCLSICFLDYRDPYVTYNCMDQQMVIVLQSIC